MNFNEYQRLAQRTSNSRGNMSKLINGVMGLNGEVGDVLWYIAEICEGLGISMEEVAIHNIEKLKKRYPDGFEEERSINREE